MKKKLFLIKCALLFGTILIGQPMADFLFQLPYKLPKEIDKKQEGVEEYIAKDNQMIDYSFIGEYQKSLELAEDSTDMQLPLTKMDSSYCRNFQAHNAVNFILNKSKNENIVIINEAHHNPRHRVFTAQLLKELYQQGFRYLGLEALTLTERHDSILNARKFPSFQSGYYIPEPQFGNLVREALKIGYVLFSYEYSSGGGATREIEQAKNIIAFLEKHPNGKTLIHCGYDHVVEADSLKDWGKAMAGRLKEYSGINPLTINQTDLTEHSKSAFENSFYKLFHADKSSVFTHRNGDIFNGPEGRNYVDISVYHPRTKYVNGRPDWLINNEKKWVNITVKKGVDFSCLALAYKSKEPEFAVPFDVVLLNSRQQNTSFALQKGRYRVVFVDKNGKERHSTLIVE